MGFEPDYVGSHVDEAVASCPRPKLRIRLIPIFFLRNVNCGTVQSALTDGEHRKSTHVVKPGVQRRRIPLI
eukprot:scaffold1123_cov253-Pinguiococcus_pyrenoidosus.AAC.10